MGATVAMAVATPLMVMEVCRSTVEPVEATSKGSGP